MSREPGPRIDRGALGLSLFYLALALPIAARKPLFHDDVFVLAVARQGGWGEIWRVLQQGADNLPPLDYWLHHLSIRAFGETQLAFHLPSILAVWAALILVYVLVQRRLNRTYAVSAALLTLVVVGWEATFVTRGRAILLVCFALVLFAWDRMNDAASRWPPVLFVVGLAAAVYAQYYGALVFAVFFAAACGQQLAQRRFSLRPFLLLLAAAILCAPLVSLARSASAYRSGFWTPVTLTALLDFFPSLLAGAVNCAVAIGLVIAFAPVVSQQDAVRSQRHGFPLGTTLALGAAVCLFVPMFVLARLVTGAFHSEYTQSAALAIVLLAVAQTVRLPISPRWLRASMIGVPAAFVVFMAARTVEGFFNEGQSRDTVRRLVEFQRGRQEAVVLGDDALFVALAYELEARPLENTTFVYDTDPSQRTNVDRAIAGLTPLMHLRTAQYDQFRRAHPSFTFIGESNNPVVVKAMRDGADVRLHWDSSAGVRYWTVRFE